MAERVTDYLEGTLSLGSRLGTRAHLFQCSSCRRYFKQMRKTIGLLAETAVQVLDMEAQLRQLDRIKAAAGDARAVADALIESGDIVVPTSAPAAVDLLLRLADALEADDGA